MTRLYNEYYRRVGVSRQICVTMNINSDCLMLCTLSRGGRDFDEIERGKLNLLSPHFTAAVRNTNSFEQLRSEQQNWQSIAESTGRAIIVLDTAGKVKNLTSRSTALLKKYFADEKLRINDLPDSLYRWLMQNIEHSTSPKEFYLPPKPLTIAIDGGKLRIQFCFNRNANSINLLLNEEKELSPQHLFHLGLTKRETEILYWIVRGKSNHEIGILCNISPRTVQKHIEHICNKLGAENRTAAAMRAVEIIH